MKYMTFQNSCSFCCLANMLEKYGLDISDRQILLDADLPYIFRYDHASDAFLTGAMLQTEADYNRALRQYGFLFVDTLVPKESIAAFLSTHIPCMIGLSAGNGGKHAMILTRVENDTLYFLNPHREHDKEPDEIALTIADLSEQTAEESHVGYLKLTPAEILAIRDSLLRPIALDLPVMMVLIGENDLRSRLLLFQKQIFALFRAGEGKSPRHRILPCFVKLKSC